MGPELIYHSDHGSRCLSIVYNKWLVEHGITASTGTVGGCYNNELIHTKMWADVVDVKIVTFE